MGLSRFRSGSMNVFRSLAWVALFGFVLSVDPEFLIRSSSTVNHEGGSVLTEGWAKPSSSSSRSSSSRSSSRSSSSSKSPSQGKPKDTAAAKPAPAPAPAPSTPAPAPAKPGYGGAKTTTPATPAPATGSTVTSDPSKKGATPATPATPASGYGGAKKTGEVSKLTGSQAKAAEAAKREQTAKAWKNSKGTGGKPPTPTQAAATRNNRAQAAYNPQVQQRNTTIINNNTTVVRNYGYTGGPMGYGSFHVGYYDGWFLTSLLVADAYNDLWWYNHWHDRDARQYAQQMNAAEYAAIEQRVAALEAKGTVRDSTYVHPNVDPDLQFSPDYVNTNPDQFYATMGEKSGVSIWFWWVLGIAVLGGVSIFAVRRYW